MPLVFRQRKHQFPNPARLREPNRRSRRIAHAVHRQPWPACPGPQSAAASPPGPPAHAAAASRWPPALNSPLASTAAAAAFTAASPVSSTGSGLASGPFAVCVSTASTASSSVLIPERFAKASSVLHRFLNAIPCVDQRLQRIESAVGLTGPCVCLLAFTAARASRSASRRFSVSRLSQSCLPLATANSHFTRPLRK